MTKLKFPIKTPQELQEQLIRTNALVADASTIATVCWKKLEEEWLDGETQLFYDNKNPKVEIYPGSDFRGTLKSNGVIESVIFIFTQYGWNASYVSECECFEFALPDVHDKQGKTVTCPVPEGRRNWDIPKILTPEELADARKEMQEALRVAEQIAEAIADGLQNQWCPENQEPVQILVDKIIAPTDTLCDKSLELVQNSFAEMGWNVYYKQESNSFYVSANCPALEAKKEPA